MYYVNSLKHFSLHQAIKHIYPTVNMTLGTSRTLLRAATKPTISSAVVCLKGWEYRDNRPNSSTRLNRLPMVWDSAALLMVSFNV